MSTPTSKPKLYVSPSARATRTLADRKAGIRRIRKYPNRRLYDERESRYINQMDLLRLVRQGPELVRVFSHSTGEDVTLHVLMQSLLMCPSLDHVLSVEDAYTWVRKLPELSIA